MKVDVFDPKTGELLQQVDLPLDEAGVPHTAVLDDRGHEVVDPTPVAPPVGFVATEPLEVLIRRMVESSQLAAAAEKVGAGTFSEEDDFAVGDDYDPSSPYEEVFEGLTRGELLANAERINAEVARRDALAAKAASSAPAGPPGTPPDADRASLDAAKPRDDAKPVAVKPAT